MAAKTYANRSLLPWQSPLIPYTFAAEHYRLRLYGAPDAPLAELELFFSTPHRRWYWSLRDLKTNYISAQGKAAGYVRPHLAERALMFALHRHLHPKK